MIPEKKYFSISEVANILQISIGNIRYWEKEFKQLKPTLSAGGTRRYVQADIDMLKTIQYLLKVQGLKIEAAKERLNKSYDKDLQTAQAIEKLMSVRDELIEIRREINYTGAMAEDTIVD